MEHSFQNVLLLHYLKVILWVTVYTICTVNKTSLQFMHPASSISLYYTDLHGEKGPRYETLQTFFTCPILHLIEAI